MECLHALHGGPKQPFSARWRIAWATRQRHNTTTGLLLPGAFFVAVGAQLFAAFMFIYFAFAAFL
jgi:hypothetical protein